jgi:hypothetical protein
MESSRLIEWIWVNVKGAIWAQLGVYSGVTIKTDPLRITPEILALLG